LKEGEIGLSFLSENLIKQKEVTSTNKEFSRKIDPEMILDYYKDWNSDNAPLLMFLDASDLENEDDVKMAYLRKKYDNLSK
jgi:hypothetical protein